MTRILLTGAGGFVGHHTLEHLLVNTDWEVVCTDSFRHKGKTDRISEVIDRDPEWKERVHIVTHDLGAPFSVQIGRKIGRIDAIISMAAESHVDRSIVEPVPFIRNNVDLILNLLEYHRAFNPDAVFIQVSTDEVYGPAPHGYAHSEWDTIIPSNPYSASKAAQEAICTSYWRTYGIPLVITNTMNIIGERQDPEKFVPKTIRRVLEGEKMTIHASSEGVPGSRFYLHARNQADALMFIIQRAMNHELDRFYWNRRNEAITYRPGADTPLRFNVVGEREIDNLEMAKMIASAAGCELDYELEDFHSSRPGHDLRYALNGTKMQVLGWEPKVPLEDSVRKTVQWTMEHPEWLL